MKRSPDRRRLPPLNALRAFEAAARHLNFSRAADELSVTPGAVSQQIQNLEDYVGAPLFRRTPKGLLLTDAAQTALPALREAFDRLAEAASLLTAAVDGRRLTLTAAPSFAATRARCGCSTSGSTRRRSKRWQRDRIVTGIFLTSVVAKINFTCGGGSSSVFNRALNALLESMCTSSMM